jgi:hypothetical protein
VEVKPLNVIMDVSGSPYDYKNVGLCIFKKDKI